MQTLGLDQDTPREGRLHVSHFRSHFLATKTEDNAVLIVKKQLQGPSTFDFYWVSQKTTFSGNWSLSKVKNLRNPVITYNFFLYIGKRGEACLILCPLIHFEKIKEKCLGIASCEVIKEVSSHMYPGPGLHTKLECCDKNLNSRPPSP